MFHKFSQGMFITKRNTLKKISFCGKASARKPTTEIRLITIAKNFTIVCR